MSFISLCFAHIPGNSKCVAICLITSPIAALIDNLRRDRLCNPAAYTHTSVAILDALKAVAIPAVEVHISDVDSREPFRQISYAGMACRHHIIGHGLPGYLEAMQWLTENI